MPMSLWFIYFAKKGQMLSEIVFLPLSNDEERESLSHSSQRSDVDNMPDIVILHRIFSLTSKSTHNFHASQELWASQDCWQHSYWRVSLDSLEFTSKHHTRMSFIEHVPSTFDVWYLHHHNSNIHKTFYCSHISHCCHVGHISQNVSRHHIP